MPVPATLSQCLQDLGPLLDAGEIIEFPELSLWTIVADGGVVVFAEYDEDAHLLILTSEAGPAPETRRAELFEALLRYGSSAHGLGGTHLALDPAGENVELVACVAEAGLEPSRLHAILLGFIDVRNDWFEKIAGWTTAPGDQPPAADAPATWTGNMRV